MWLDFLLVLIVWNCLKESRQREPNFGLKEHKYVENYLTGITGWTASIVKSENTLSWGKYHCAASLHPKATYFLVWSNPVLLYGRPTIGWNSDPPQHCTASLLLLRNIFPCLVKSSLVKWETSDRYSDASPQRWVFSGLVHNAWSSRKQTCKSETCGRSSRDRRRFS